jgi:Na+-driven multidrug efflux pump
VIGVGMSYVDHVAWSYVCFGIGIALGSAIQGAGATLQTLKLDATVVFGLQLPLSLASVYLTDWGTAGLFKVVAITYTAFAVVYALSYRRGAFLDTALA